MAGEILSLFKAPVTVTKKRAEGKNIKKECIITVVIALVIAVITVLTTYITAIKSVNKVYKSYKTYSEKYSFSSITKDDFKEMKKEAKKDALEYINFTKVFFTTFGVTILVVLVIAGMMYIISRLVKSPMDYLVLLSITNSAFMIYSVGFILNAIFAFIYAPIGFIIMVAAFIYALGTLVNAFKESMNLEDTDKFVLFTTIVITAVITALCLIAYKYISSLLSIF